MTFINQAQMLKAAGFRFNRIKRWGRSKGPIYTLDVPIREVSVVLTKSKTAKGLKREILDSKISREEILKDLVHKRAWARRRLMRAIDGGYAWLPMGIRTPKHGTKTAVLTLVTNVA